MFTTNNDTQGFITSITVKRDVEQPDSRNIIVEWLEGELVDGRFVTRQPHLSVLRGEALTSQMNEEVTPGASHIDDFEDALARAILAQPMPQRPKLGKPARPGVR